MKLSDFIETLRQAFEKGISVKTGWGRVELRQVFEKAISDTLAQHTSLQ